METVREAVITEPKDLAPAKNMDCCLKCKGANNNTCSKQLSLNNQIQKEKSNEHGDLEDLQPDVLAEYIYRQHHEYYYEEEPVLAGMLTNCINQFKATNYGLQTLERLFRTLRNDITSHLLTEEKVLFPCIKDMIAARKSFSYVGSLQVKNITKHVLVMKVEHNSAEAFLEEIETITNRYTPSSLAPEAIISLFKKLKAFHENLTQYIYIENHILFPKVLLLKEELTNLRLL